VLRLGARRAGLVCLLAAACAGVVGAGPRSATIFMYHHIAPTIAPGPYARALTVTPAEFDRQLTWLRDHACAVVTVDELWHDVRDGQADACEAALTFDDGYADVARYAEPLLIRYGDDATLYVTTGYVGSPGHVSRRDLLRARDLGWEIGAHTVHHLDVTRLSGSAARREVRESAAALREWLGEPVLSFAYPAGANNRQVRAEVAAAGFATAVTTQPGLVVAGDDPYALPRLRVVRNAGVRLFAAVWPHAAAGPDARAVRHIARERSAGNERRLAEAIAAALLARDFPEPFERVEVQAVPPASVAGIVLSGVKFHVPVDASRFAHDVRRMLAVAFAAAPSVREVDIWAEVPRALPAHAVVAGDEAVPTERTVFSAAVPREQHAPGGGWRLGRVYWDPTWLAASHRARGKV
jgi:peptidoglycan/xylan/chitin deacetylase (PgdA/CDA1 family)